MANIKDFIKKIGNEAVSLEEQQKALAAVEKTIVEAKAKREESIGKNVDLVIAALKKIESDLNVKLVELNNTPAKQGIQGPQGPAGKDGRDGKDGYAGRDGKDGVDGIDGKDGKDGISVTDAQIDFDGSLLITLSDGREIDAGTVLPLDVAKQIHSVSTNGGGTSQYVLDSLAALQTQINSLIPSQTGNSGKYLTTDGTNTYWGTISSSGTVTSVSGTGSVNGITLSGTVTSSGNLTLGGTLGSIANSQLTNSAITINGTSTSLGGSISVGTVTSITAGTGLSGGTITGSGTIAIDSTVATLTGTQTLTNKRVTNRIGSNGGTTSGNITPTSDTADQYNITGLTGTSAIQIPSGTPTDGQRLSIRIKDNGTGRTLSWVTTAGGYRVIGTTLPLTTTANKTIYVGCVYNSADSYWDVVAVASEV